jgi:group I intron endonuclease
MNTDTGIYTITSPSGKQYIGSATSFKARWKHHRNQLRRRIHVNAKLQHAWNKYGEENMIFAKMVLCSITDLLVLEQARIDSLKPEYNIASIAGSSMQGRMHSAATLSAMSAAAMKRSPEWGLKLSARQKGKNNPMYGRTGERNPHFGKILSPEHRAMLSVLASNRTGANSQRGRAMVCNETGACFVTASSAADWLRSNGHPNARPAHIGAVARGERPKAYGFTWRYAD